MMTVQWSDQPEPVVVYQQTVDVESAEQAIEYVRTYCRFNRYPEPRWFYVARASLDQIAQLRPPTAIVAEPTHRRRKATA